MSYFEGDTGGGALRSYVAHSVGAWTGFEDREELDVAVQLSLIQVSCHVILPAEVPRLVLGKAQVLQQGRAVCGVHLHFGIKPP